ncbi:uncharacterized protein METZ01_LOCUS401160, partial [marine metagenome]
PPDLPDAFPRKQSRNQPRTARRRSTAHRLPRLPWQAALRRPGRLHAPPHPGTCRPGPPRRGPVRPAVPGPRRPGPVGRVAQPRPLQRPLSDAKGPLLGVQERVGRRRGDVVQHRELLGAHGIQHARLGPPTEAPPGLRPGPRQPVPRLGPAPDAGAPRDACPRHHPPSHHDRQEARDRTCPHPLGGDRQAPLVLVHEDADPGGEADAPGHDGLRVVPIRHHRRPQGPRRPDTRRTRRRRPRPVPTRRGHHPDPGPHRHDRQRRRGHEGPPVPTRGGRQAPHGT